MGKSFKRTVTAMMGSSAAGVAAAPALKLKREQPLAEERVRRVAPPRGEAGAVASI